MTTLAVDILYIEGCVNYTATLALVERLVADLGVDADIRPVLIADEDSARRMRFLGSPTIRVAGVDVDPIETTDWGFACRLAVPEQESRIRHALRSAVRS